jgi:hypothetical protein
MSNSELERWARESRAVQSLSAGCWQFNQHQLREFARRVLIEHGVLKEAPAVTDEPFVRGEH